MRSAPLIAHVTDPHLLADPGAHLHGWPVAAAFERVLADVRQFAPALDALVLGGDLVDDCSAAGYRWLDAHLAELDCPVLAVAGNHDAPERMPRLLTRARVHKTLALGGWQLIGLNTHVDGAEHGALAAEELERLTRSLADTTRHTLVVLHHPPMSVGTPWIDAIGLRSPARFIEALTARGTSARGVLAGHVHQAVTTQIGGRPVWTTPSTMRQFRAGAYEFAEDHNARPGWRWLRLGIDGAIDSGVRRIDPTGLTPLSA